MKKNPNCKTCGQQLKRIVYGFPSSMPTEEDNWVLGGCVVTGDDPQYYCPNCDNEDEFEDEIK